MDLQCFLIAVVLKGLGCKAKCVALQWAGLRRGARQNRRQQDGSKNMKLQCFLMATVMNESEQIRKLRLNLSES